jgi:hypothetical protein
MFLFLLISKENESPLKSVDGNFYFRMFFDGFPSFGHGSGPMNVVENPNGFVRDGW